MAEALQRGRFAFAALLLANLFLTFGPWLVRVTEVGPAASAFWRLALAVPLLMLLASRSGAQGFAPARAFAWTIFLGGLFFAADLAAWHYGIVRTKMANSTLFGNTSGFFFAAYGFLAARSLPRPAQLGALLLAIAGTALLLGSSYELSARHFTGDLLAILAGFLYALYLVAMDRVRKEMKPLPALALSTLAGAGPLLLFALAMGERILPSDWTPLILLSLGSQVLGQGLLVYSIGHLAPVVVGIGLLTQPIAAAMLGWLVYSERMSLADVAGAILIGFALLLIRLPGRRRLASDGPETHVGADRRVP